MFPQRNSTTVESYCFTKESRYLLSMVFGWYRQWSRAEGTHACALRLAFIKCKYFLLFTGDVKYAACTPAEAILLGDTICPAGLAV